MVNFGYYKGIYLGDKVGDVSKFQRLAKKAELTLRQKTFNKISEVTDEEVRNLVQWTICELVDIYVISDNLDNVKQESLGDSSITYRDKDVNEQRVINNVIRRNLELTGLLRRGWGYVQ